MNAQGPITLPAVWAGMPPALLLSVGIHLVVIFGFLIAPTSESALNVTNRAVTVLLSKSAFAQKDAVTEAADNQQQLDERPRSIDFAGLKEKSASNQPRLRRS